MKTLWVDATNGAAGDMLLAALIDAGANIAAVREGLDRLPVEPTNIVVTEVRRHGLRAIRVSVEAQASHHTRNLADILTLISEAGLPDPVRQFAADVFGRLARAEAQVIGPILAGVRSPRRGRKPAHWTAVDRTTRPAHGHAGTLQRPRHHSTSRRIDNICRSENRKLLAAAPRQITQDPWVGQQQLIIRMMAA